MTLLTLPPPRLSLLLPLLLLLLPGGCSFFRFIRSPNPAVESTSSCACCA
jgi:hypothetical protein